MNFQGINNQYAELYIMGIDDAPLITEKNDLWLKVFLNVSAFMGSWQAYDTSLTLNDVRKLIRWLEDLSAGGTETSKLLYFTEPNLSFCHLNTRETGKTIKISFNYELRPDDPDERLLYYLTCRLTDAELRVLADELIYDLQNMFDKESGFRCKERFADLQPNVNDNTVSVES